MRKPGVDDPRIRRNDEFPQEIVEELANDRTYLYKHRLEPSSGPIFLEYRIGRMKRFFDEGQDVKYREVFCWISRNGQRVGAVSLNDWMLEPYTGNAAFLDEMDSTQESRQFAEAVTSVWDVDKLTWECSIVEGAFAWVRPGDARRSEWAAAINFLLEKHFDRGTAALLLKAFPLQYRRHGILGSPFEKGLAHRQAAMIRLYRRVLGVVPLPGWAGDDGWLWRPLSSGVPKPRIRYRI